MYKTCGAVKSAKRADPIPLVLRSNCEHGVSSVRLLSALRFHLNPQLVQLLISQGVQLLETQPELASKVTKTVFIIRPAFVEVLRAVKTVLEYLKPVGYLVLKSSVQF